MDNHDLFPSLLDVRLFPKIIPVPTFLCFSLIHSFVQ